MKLSDWDRFVFYVMGTIILSICVGSLFGMVAGWAFLGGSFIFAALSE